MGPLTRVVQTGIGLAAELKAASKERKASEVTVEDGPPGEHGLWSLIVMLLLITLNPSDLVLIG